MTSKPSGKSEAIAITKAITSNDPALDRVAGDIVRDARAEGRETELTLGMAELIVGLLDELRASGAEGTNEELLAAALDGLDEQTAARVRRLFGDAG